MLKDNMIKPEHWILLALKDASHDYGFDIQKWGQFEKPKEFDITNTDFRVIIDRLEQQGIIKRAIKEQGNFYLSNKGKKDLLALKKQLKYKEYILIISNFPIIELKERVKSLESFVLSSIILTAGSILTVGIIFKLTPILSHNINILYILLFLFYVFVFISAYYTGESLGSILLFKINDMQRETLLIYKEWYWNNQNVINKVIAGLFTIVIIVLLDHWGISTMINSIVLLLFGLLAIWLWETFKKNPEKQS